MHRMPNQLKSTCSWQEYVLSLFVPEKSFTGLQTPAVLGQLRLMQLSEVDLRGIHLVDKSTAGGCFFGRKNTQGVTHPRTPASTQERGEVYDAERTRVIQTFFEGPRERIIFFALLWCQINWSKGEKRGSFTIFCLTPASALLPDYLRRFPWQMIREKDRPEKCWTLQKKTGAYSIMHMHYLAVVEIEHCYD